MRRGRGDAGQHRGRGMLGAVLFGIALLGGMVFADALPEGPLPAMPAELPGPSHPIGASFVATVHDPAAPEGPRGAVPPPPGRTRVSLNHASTAELEALPGIGPALAARIVAGRPYAAVAELDRVRGIGPKTLARLSPRLKP